jgi:hypothetical protein
MNRKTAFPWRKVFAVSEVYARFDPKGVKIAQIIVRKSDDGSFAIWNILATEMIDGDAITGRCETLDYAFELVDDTLEMHGWTLLCTDMKSETAIRL